MAGQQFIVADMRGHPNYVTWTYVCFFLQLFPWHHVITLACWCLSWLELAKCFFPAVPPPTPTLTESVLLHIMGLKQPQRHLSLCSSLFISWNDRTEPPWATGHCPNKTERAACETPTFLLIAQMPILILGMPSSSSSSSSSPPLYLLNAVGWLSICSYNSRWVTDIIDSCHS